MLFGGFVYCLFCIPGFYSPAYGFSIAFEIEQSMVLSAQKDTSQVATGQMLVVFLVLSSSTLWKHVEPDVRKEWNTEAFCLCFKQLFAWGKKHVFFSLVSGSVFPSYWGNLLAIGLFFS